MSATRNLISLTLAALLTLGSPTALRAGAAAGPSAGSPPSESSSTAEVEAAPVPAANLAALMAEIEALRARVEALEQQLAEAAFDVSSIVDQTVASVVTVYTYDWLGRVDGVGSGFFAYEGDVIMTNAHVVADAQAIRVLLHDGRVLDARQWWVDDLSDLGLIWVEGGPYPSLQFGSSSDLEPGDPLVVIGSAEGLHNTVTRGILSGINRNAGMHYPALQTDAAINPGNSGGPILNAQGEVVGIASAKLVDAEAIGFGIPADEIQRLMAHFDKTRGIVRPWLGVVLSEGEDTYLGLPSETPGLTVVSVAPDGAAAGVLQPGDIILWLNQWNTQSLLGMRRAIEAYQPEDTVELTIRRHGRPLVLAVKLGEFSVEVEPAIPPLWNPEVPWEDIF